VKVSYAQTNYPNVRLGDGSCGESIASAGCYVTTDADILTWMGHPIDPPGLNAEYLAKGLFQGGCLINSDTLSRARPDQVALIAEVNFPGAADLGQVDNQAVDEYVALRINYPHGLPADQSHFLPVYDYKAGAPASTLQVLDSYDGQIKPLNRYGDPATIISAVMRYKKLSGAAPAPPPSPIGPPAPPPAPATADFTATITADGGAWAHSSPTLDPKTRVDLIDKGAVVSFNAWCHAGPEVAAVPDARTQAVGDDRMFRSSVRGLWIASAMVLGVPGPATPQIPGPGDPAPAPAPPPASVVVPFTGDPHVLEGRWAWEFTDQGDYAQLKADGFDGVLIRAFNGDGGPLALQQAFAWTRRSSMARNAGLKAVAWTYWYGPGEPGYTEPDPAAYLARCAEITATLGLDTPGWVIDAEAHSLAGLAPALKTLRDHSGKAVFLCPPGDPNEFGFTVDWLALDAVVDGYVPQMYTGAWGAAVSLSHALSEWNAAKPLYPASDEQDPVKALAWIGGVLAPLEHIKGYSYWRIGVGTTDTLRAYGQVPPAPITPPTPDPIPTPATTGYFITASNGVDLTGVTAITDLRGAMGLADVYAKAHLGVSVYVKDQRGVKAYTAFQEPGPPPVQPTPADPPPPPPAGFWGYLQQFFRWLMGKQ
jgi:hypothetical protein